MLEVQTRKPARTFNRAANIRTDKPTPNSMRTRGLYACTQPLTTAPFRNRQKARPTHTAGNHANTPEWAGSESNPQPRRFACSACSRQPFRPVSPVSGPVALATRPRSPPAVFDADRFPVCARAWPNPCGNPRASTRGITSCSPLPILRPQPILRGTRLGSTVLPKACLAEYSAF